MSKEYNLPRQLLLWSRSSALRSFWRASLPKGLRRVATETLLDSFIKQQLAIRVDPKTVLLADFPRCGNTWIRYMLATLLHWRETGTVVKLDAEEFYRYCPTLAGEESYKPYYFLDNRSFLKTHMEYRPEFRRGIVTYRDPFEATRSLYILIDRNNAASEGHAEPVPDPTQFLIKWMNTFHTFYSGWLAAHDKRPADFLFILYDDLVSQTAQSLTAMVEFVGLKEQLTSEVIEAVSGLYTRRDVSWKDEQAWAMRQDAETSLHETMSLGHLRRVDSTLADNVAITLDRLQHVRALPSR